MSGYDDLFGEAETELEQEEIPVEWGGLREPVEGERLLTRYLGTDVLPPFGDTVYRFVSYPDGAPFYLRSKARLTLAIDNASPAVGDIVAIVRGKDKDIGKERPMQTWAVRARPCDEPLTDSATPRPDPDDIPF